MNEHRNQERYDALRERYMETEPYNDAARIKEVLRHPTRCARCDERITGEGKLCDSCEEVQRLEDLDWELEQQYKNSPQFDIDFEERESRN